MMALQTATHVVSAWHPTGTTQVVPRTSTVCNARTGYNQRQYGRGGFQTDSAPDEATLRTGYSEGQRAPQQPQQSRTDGSGRSYGSKPQWQQRDDNTREPGMPEGAQRAPTTDYPSRRPRYSNADGQQRRPYNNERSSMTQEVNRLVRDVADWRDLKPLLDTRGRDMGLHNIENIITKVSRTQRPDDPTDAIAYDKLMPTLLGWVLALMPNSRPRSAASMISALGRAQVNSPEVMTELIKKVETELDSLPSYALVGVIDGCARLNYQLPPDTLTKLETVLSSRFADMYFNDTIVVLKSLHQLGALAEAKPWLDSAMQSLEKAALAFPLTMEAYKASTSWPRGREQQQQQGESRTSEAATGEVNQVAEATSPGVSEPAAASPPPPPSRPQREGYVERDYTIVNFTEYIDAATTLANIAKDTGYQPSQSLVDAFFSRQQWRVAFLKLDQASRLLWCVSNLTARPAMQWFGIILDGIARQDRMWNPQDISTVCLYLGRYLQLPATPLLTTKLLRFADEQANRKELGPDGVANILYVLAVTQYKPPDRWLDDMLIFLKQNMHTCSFTSLESIYNGLPLLGSGFRLQEVVAEAGRLCQTMAASAEGQQQFVADSSDAAYEAQAV